MPTFGQKLKIAVFGQSHSEYIGAVIENFPCGFSVDYSALDAFMALRAPGGELSTKRKEPDKVIFASGITNGVTNGADICLLIKNTDIRPSDYAQTADTPRPSHADYTAHIKYSGFEDKTGGGAFSGRLTAPLCAAGALCLQYLASFGISIGAHIYSIHGINDTPFDSVNPDFSKISATFPVINAESGELMKAEIIKARENGDSVGGIIECAVLGLKPGFGGAMTDGLEGKLALSVFGIPAVKGMEFGSGFKSSELYGSENNDEFYYRGEEIRTKTNNCGGILGGISNGMPLLFRAAFKPTPSVAKEQNTVSYSEKKDVKISVSGRHDPCIVVRAVPCVTAAAAVTVLDVILSDK